MIKYNRKLQLLSFLLLTVAVVSLLQSCKKETYSLAALPTPDFEILPGADANTVMLVNKTSSPSMSYWTVSTGQKLSGDSATIKFIFAGTYNITLLAAAQGGLVSVTKPVTIAASDPTACNPANPLGFIASCTQKTWKLNPAGGAYMVGPGPGNGSWWSSVAGDVTARACEFNDEYTFHFNATGTFEYDNKGDYFSDGYIGTSPDPGACKPNSSLTPAHQPWGSGSFNFSVVGGAGVNGLGQLTVRGVGAHIGLQKVHNGGETTSGPVSNAITYDILEMQSNVGGNGYDILKLGVHIGGDGWWTFTLRSF